MVSLMALVDSSIQLTFNMIEINLIWLLYGLYAYLGITFLTFCLLSLISLSAEDFEFKEVFIESFKWPIGVWYMLFK